MCNYKCSYNGGMKFEWDEAKRRGNLSKYGVDFLAAAALFDGRPVVTAVGRHPDEPRFLTTGELHGRFFTAGSSRPSGRGAGTPSDSCRQGRHGMRNGGHTVRAAAGGIDQVRRRGEGHTDHARLDAMTEAGSEASVDRAEEGEVDWNTVRVGIPGPKQQLTVRLDRDVVA